MNSRSDMRQNLVSKIKTLGIDEKQISSEESVNNGETYRRAFGAILHIKPLPKAPSGKLRYSQIIDIINLAKELSFTIHVVSRGMNLGYGGEEPYERDAIVVNLSAFNKIDNYDPALGHIRVEPGVTQEDIYKFLKTNGSQHIHDTTGAPKSASIIGNYLDRGFGHTPMAEHPKNILNASVIIPGAKGSVPAYRVTSLDGTILKAKDDTVVRTYTIGPDYTQLFVQSNLGVVTNVTIKLFPVTESFVAFIVPFQTKEADKVISLCAELRKQGTIHSASHVGNAVKTLQMIAAEHPSLIKSYNSDYISGLIQSLNLNDWTISGGIYGTKNQVRAHVKDLKREMSKIGLAPLFLGPKKRFCLRHLAVFLTKNKKLLERGLVSKIKLIRSLSTSVTLSRALNKLCDVKQGKPTNYFLKTIYWRNLHKLKDVNNLSPVTDKVGLIWGAPCAKFSSKNFAIITSMMEQVCYEYKMESPISVTMLNERTMEFVLSLSYDRLNPTEEEAALKCYENIMLKAEALGFTQYRMSTLSNSFLTKEALKLETPLITLKSHLDPCGVLSPSKYKIVSG
ncbi:FAD-binding oxidoreductase [Alteromonas sp. MTD1]|uniref:FAD-binding oxidoreductase n=1 Tax=Alteromonas sp. MTD1 TaxID=3057962 RepID=UPI0036F22A9A